MIGGVAGGEVARERDGEVIGEVKDEERGLQLVSLIYSANAFSILVVLERSSSCASWKNYEHMSVHFWRRLVAVEEHVVVMLVLERA